MRTCNIILHSIVKYIFHCPTTLSYPLATTISMNWTFNVKGFVIALFGLQMIVFLSTHTTMCSMME